MVRQHLYRVLPEGGRTIAASPSLKESAWLHLLEQQMNTVDYAALPVPIFYQYPLGRGLVISRCAPDPLGEEGAFLAHQLVLDEMEDMEKLTGVRPLALSHFLPYYLESGAEELNDLLPEALGDQTDLNDCYDAFDRLLGGKEQLVSQMLACLALCARDKRQYIRATLNDTPENVSMFGRQITELMLRALPMEDALRISYCSLQPVDSINMQYSICFSPDGGQQLEPSAQEILIDLNSGTVNAAQGVEMPDAGRYYGLARRLLAHEIGRPGGGAQNPDEGLDMPPFREGMSLKKYFAEWSEALSTRRDLLNDEGFRALAGREWQKMLEAVVAAGEVMENSRMIIELSSILVQISKNRLEKTLELDGDTLTDLIVLLLDSISWRTIDLSDVRLERAVRNACSYAKVISSEQFPEERLLACRIVHRLLDAHPSIMDAMNDMAELEGCSLQQFEALQHCFKHYVHKRLHDDFELIDERLAAAAMLGCVKFADGIPDLRAANLLAEKIEAKMGASAARQFQKILERLSKSHRSSHDGVMILQRRDMKLFLVISLALMALIGGITGWFLLMS